MGLAAPRDAVTATSVSCFPKLAGVQLAIPTLPPDLRTRNSSAAVTSGRGANIAPNTEVTQSKRPSAKGSDSTSASAHWMASPSAWVLARPSWTRAGVRSEATTRAPLRATAIAQLPLPAATSSTSCPAAIPHASTRSWAAGSSSIAKGR